MSVRPTHHNSSRNPSHQPLGSREQSPEAHQPTPVPEASEHPTPDPAQRLLLDSLDLPQMLLPPFPGNPDFSQPEGTPFEEAPKLAMALMLITEELRRHDRSTPAPKLTKAKEPDTFDSSDPKKLNNFILLCNLYFRTNPSYEDDGTKVTFALSYLRGLALEYFEPHEPSILDSDETPD